jgi:hypothetical protein
MPAVGCVEGDLRGEAVMHEREQGGTGRGEHAALQILGAGWFTAATVVKKGGSGDQTTVTVELDGEPMMSVSFADLKSGWRRVDSNLLRVSVRTEGDTDTLTIWFGQELKFRALAQVRADVDESGVEGLRVSAIMNKPAPHEHVPGQQGTLAALPAFQ